MAQLAMRLRQAAAIAETKGLVALATELAAIADHPLERDAHLAAATERRHTPVADPPAPEPAPAGVVRDSDRRRVVAEPPPRAGDEPGWWDRKW